MRLASLRRPYLIASVAALALWLSACGDDDTKSGGDPTTIQEILDQSRGPARGPGTHPANGPTARIEVKQIFRPKRPYAVEGSVSSVSIVRGNQVVLERDFPYPAAERPQHLLSGHLSPGIYRVLSEHRSCGASLGDCPASGPAEVRCSGPFHVAGREPVDVLITFNPAQSTCRIETGFVELG